jgi:8-oxo-dGTP pyrophosphatase MutT (NUDIX family)
VKQKRKSDKYKKQEGKPFKKPSKGKRTSGVDRVEISVFNAILISDEILYKPSLEEDDLVLLVHNMADSGKPAGWGMPGGGVKDKETAAQAAKRECQYETGIRVREVRPLGAEFDHYKKHLVNKHNNETFKSFNKSSKEREVWVKNPNNVIVIGNPWLVYQALIEWENSAHQRLFRNYCQKASNLSDAWVAENGIHIYFPQALKDGLITPEEINSLNIIETDEIDGLALVPISFLEKKIQSNQVSSSDPSKHYYFFHTHAICKFDGRCVEPLNTAQQLSHEDLLREEAEELERMLDRRNPRDREILETFFDFNRKAS